MFLDNEIIGMYQFAYDDLSVRPDIYPWLANVYIDEIFLYTKHIGLYEKFGWAFLEEVDTFKKEQRIERLYKLDLK